MYTRITSFKANSASLSDLPAKVKEMATGAKALPGIIDIYVSWRADGQGVVASVYKDKASADSATAEPSVSPCSQKNSCDASSSWPSHANPL